LYDVLVDEGTLITPQTPLAIIGKANSLLELEVDENDMVRVAIGQKAIVTLDSYKGEVLKRLLIKFSQLWMPVPAPLKLKHIFYKYL
jgi:multidrug resistance efflux pump